MSKGKVKRIEKNVKDPEIIEMFNQMMGNGDPDMTVALPKYNNIVDNLTNIAGLLNTFIDRLNKSIEGEFPKVKSEIEGYIKQIRLDIDTFSIDQNQLYNPEDLKNPEKLKNFMSNKNFIMSVKTFSEKYKGIKECKSTLYCVKLCRDIQRLVEEEREKSKSKMHNLADKDQLKDLFIINAEGENLNIFGETSTLNFKQIFLNDDFDPVMKKFILFALHLLYKRTKNLAEIITSPDIDIASFSEKLVGYISTLKSHIPRCDAAFKAIEQSVSLLKGNFNGYYKDFVISGNPSTIIESFVMDVSQEHSGDIAMVRQFGEIIKFCKQRMQSKSINDPKLNSLMNIIGDKMSMVSEDKEKTKENEN